MNFKKILLMGLSYTGIYYPILLFIKKVPFLNKWLLHYGWSDKSGDYHRQMYDGFKARIFRAGLVSKLQGSDIIEIGSGKNPAMGQYFLENEFVNSYTGNDFYNVVTTDRHHESKLKVTNFDITSEKIDCEQEYDFLFSNAVLEHIPASLMNNVFANFNKLLKKGAYMLHQIDFRDHINFKLPFNNLKFTPDQWDNLTLDTIFYTNRFRLDDFIFYASKNGFEVVLLERENFKGQISLNYSNCTSLEKLYDVGCFIVLRKL